MQFIGAKGVMLFVAIVIVACGAGFGSGLLIGRQYPAHHFEKMENSHYLYDTSTGHVCDFYPAQSPTSASDFYKSLNLANTTIPPCN
jgi:hypothetical protein